MSNYVCSNCGAAAYYDGRCGDGPVLMCGCDKRGRRRVNEGSRGDWYTRAAPNLSKVRATTTLMPTTTEDTDMKELPPLRVWVFVDVNGMPCLVQTTEPCDSDFQHFGERCFRYELDCDEPPRIKEMYPR